MVPVVALVGRPNVGKSTLFNRLTRTRDALVADFPGLTRDRKYGRAEIEGREFICIDTGGIDGTEDGVETRMAEQSLLAIEEADVVLFMVDARAGLMPADEAIAKHLRSREKPTFLVANKTDGLDPDQAVVDFYSLGLGEIYPIAASHGRGVLSLLVHVLLPWMEDLAPQEEVDEDAEYWAQFEAEENGEEEEEDDFDPQSLPIKLAIVGRPNVGKSTLTNALVGQKIAITTGRPETTRHNIRGIVHGEKSQLVLVDTPGYHRPRTLLGKRLNDMVREALAEVDVVVFCLPADQRIGPGDKFIARELKDVRRPIIAVATKCDLVSRERLMKHLLSIDKMGDFAAIIPVSAFDGNGVDQLLDVLTKTVPLSPPLYPDGDVTDESRDTLIAEFIREAALEGVRDELPHSLAVQVEEIVARPRRQGDTRPPLMNVHVNVYVERDSQKAIIIGKKGSRLKEIGSKSRPLIEDLLKARVYLDLHVRTAKDWQSDPKMLGRLGF